MLFLALSCLQGRPMRAAFDELARLGQEFGYGGVQLTPGNHPTPEFEAHVAQASVSTRSHHGFDFERRKRDVWSADGACLAHVDSIHPPVHGSPSASAIADVAAWLEQRGADEPILETMVPGYVLGSGAELEEAMRLRVPLAVDVSHVFIQRCAGAMTDATWKRLESYDRVREVHVSANAGAHDSHAPLTSASFGLEWARARLADGTPTVLECYMHRLSASDRARQIELLLECSPRVERTSETGKAISITGQARKESIPCFDIRRSWR